MLVVPEVFFWRIISKIFSSKIQLLSFYRFVLFQTLWKPVLSLSIILFWKYILANWAKIYLYLLDWWLWLDHWVHVQKSGLEQFELFFCFEGTWHFWKNLTASGLVWRVLMRILCCFLLYYRHNFISNYFRKS